MNCLFTKKNCLNGKTVKEIALYFKVSYNYLRNWLSKTLYFYFKILAQDLNYYFPNNQFNFSGFIQLLEKNNYLQESYLFSEVKQTLGNVNIILNYVGQEKKDGKLKPKFTVSFNLEIQYFNSEIIEQIVTTINVMSLDDRWIIVADNVLDKKIIRRILSVRRDTLPLCTGKLLLIFLSVSIRVLTLPPTNQRKLILNS
jgi:hypothetical protein